MIYLLIFSFSFFAFLRYINSTSRQDGKVVYVFLWLSLVLLAGLRYRVGGDTLHYFDVFDSYPTLSTLWDYDFAKAEYNPGWIVFNAIIKTFSDSFYTFQFIHALILNTIVFYTIQKYSRNKFLVVIFYLFFYFLYFNMEILRESLAIAFFLFAIPSLLNKNWVSYYVMCLLSFSFHSSALILIILPLFAKKIKAKYQIFFMVVLALLINFISIDGVINSIFGSFAFAQRASRGYLILESNIVGIIVPAIKIIAFFAIYFYAQQKNICINHPFIILITPFIILGVMSCFIPGMYRFLNYLAIPILIYIADVLYTLIRIRRKQVTSLLKVAFCFFILISLQLHYYNRDMSKYARKKSTFFNLYLPYHSIFDEKIYQTREDIYYNQFK